MNVHLSKLFSLCLLMLLSTLVQAQTAEPTPDQAAAAEASASAEPSENSSAGDLDPWQGYNRAMFNFNSKVDKHLLKPLAKTYVRYTPGFFRQGVANVFANIGNVPSAFNGLLQGKFASAAHDSGRLLVNTTLGVAGLVDVAKHMGLPAADGEDFGQTLAVWGVGPGPFVVLPFMGPSTVRDTAALPIDWYADPKSYIEDIRTKNSVRALSIVDTRASFLALEKSVTGDKYLFIRDAYLQRRNYLEKDGQVEDSFGADEEGGDYGF